MGFTFTSSLPAATTASLAQLIDSGLLNVDNIVVECACFLLRYFYDLHRLA